MTTNDECQARLAALMEEHSLSGETRLYRQTLAEHLTAAGEPDVFRISANPSPSEAVVDVYGHGHTGGAEHVGPGLAFVEKSADEWHSGDRVAVELRLQDVLDQGGLIYPVESVVTEKTWYVTLPAGDVAVRKL